MQIGTYVTFDEPLSEDEIKFIEKLNRLLNPPTSSLESARPVVRIIYKPFNPQYYQLENGDVKILNPDDSVKVREAVNVYARNPDLPPVNYSLGIKVTGPALESIPKDAPPGMKRVFKKLLG